jgi:hypothetical protein
VVSGAPLGSGHTGGQNQLTVESGKKEKQERENLYRGIATRAIITVATCAAWAFWTSLRLRSYGSIHTTEARLVVHRAPHLHNVAPDRSKCRIARKQLKRARHLCSRIARTSGSAIDDPALPGPAQLPNRPKGARKRMPSRPGRRRLTGTRHS